ncbi:Gfo/Idh/MocA family oxidoreductase [Aestuariibacter sp. AA17]|uniref:Gfo/Idh/MocA family oxidoreductase n=1 Tax=Fluctibacter corallii TaxID=2984329 RepID=A0ABT3AA14_9ALTE|nr:Gfo/Idh/MocA family oxidoreductase [Aestuariibacter sp. AA17]MCV2885516.1 Gfo/Idh/MocA family oxidoreductase [Aestuariibacter sp. AA17]
MTDSSKRKIRMGMVGGGEGAFIGAVHRMAARLDGDIELVCGAFSGDADKSRQFGESLNLAPSRCYGSYEAMMREEAALPASEKMDFVAVVTPNHLHFPVAKLALEQGFHVMSDKPATFSYQEALQLKKTVDDTQRLYGLTHVYTAYPMIREAQAKVQNGELGAIRKMVVEYSQGWLASKEAEDGKQAKWRLDPSKAGVSCCMGDIGVHAANLVEFVSGLQITAICADLTSVVPGRRLDDDGTVLLQFDNGSKGVLLASQIATGEENNLHLRIYGDKASIEWRQMSPNTLILRDLHGHAQHIRSGVGALHPQTHSAMRLPAGHPEGYLEAFGNLYAAFAHAIHEYNSTDKAARQFVPGINEALRGMAFIEQVVEASNQHVKWCELKQGRTV